MILFTLISALTIFLRKQRGHNIAIDFESLMILALVASFVVRYLLHPVMEDRFLIAGYLIILVGFYKTLAQNLSSSRNTA